MSGLPRILVDILAPVFLVVAVGYVSGRRLGLDTRSLSKLAYWILGPVFMFRILVGAQLDADVVLRLIGATVLCVAVVGLAAVGLARIGHRPLDRTGAVAMTAVFGNGGNFGLAVVAFAYGEHALAAAGVVMLTINTVGLAVGITVGAAQHRGTLAGIRTAATTPLLVAVIPAVAVNVTRTSLPLWIDRPVTLVASALIPTMLLTLGMQLAEMGMPRLQGDAVLSGVLKLVVSPAVAWGAVLVTGLSGVPAGVVILQAAMPAAVFTALVALEHDLAPDLVTTVVLSTTLASALTLPVVVSLLL